MDQRKIAIIGADHAGLLLARLLHCNGIAATIFEESPSLYLDSPYTTHYLSPNSGVPAMKEAALLEEVEKVARYEHRYNALVDKDLNYHNVTDADSSAKTNPRIGFNVFREILLRSLPEDTIQWGHRLRTVEKGTTLVFEHKTLSGWGLVVGTDGKWSKLRGIVAPSIVPIFTGIGTIEMSVPDAERNVPELYKIVNHGHITAVSDGSSLSLELGEDGSLAVGASFMRQDQYWMDKDQCEFKTSSINETKQALEMEFQGWRPELLSAIRQAQGAVIAKSHCILPIGTAWEHEQGFTLIGDAAHGMASHGSFDINTSIEDARLLARIICDNIHKHRSLDEQIKSFEEAMFVRMKSSQQLSYDVTQIWMKTKNPRSIMPKLLSRVLKNGVPTVLHPLMTALAYTHYFFETWWL